MRLGDIPSFCRVVERPAIFLWSEVRDLGWVPVASPPRPILCTHVQPLLLLQNNITCFASTLQLLGGIL